MSEQPGKVVIDLSSPDPTQALNAFLWHMAKARELRLMPRTEHTLIEHLVRGDARVLFYSTIAGVLSVVEGNDMPLDDDDGFDEIMALLSRQRKRRIAAKQSTHGHRIAVAADFSLTPPPPAGADDGIA